MRANPAAPVPPASQQIVEADHPMEAAVPAGFAEPDYLVLISPRLCARAIAWARLPTESFSKIFLT